MEKIPALAAANPDFQRDISLVPINPIAIPLGILGRIGVL